MKTTLLEVALLVATVGLAASCSSSNNPVLRPNKPCSPACGAGSTCSLGRCLTTLAENQNQPNAIAVAGSSVYWTSSGPCPIDGGACQDNGTVLKVSTAGGKVSTLASDQKLPWALATDGTNVYWVNDNATGTVMSVPIDGGHASTVASKQENPDGIAVDSTSVYWTTAGTVSTTGIQASTGAILKAPKGGGAPTTLASDQNLPHGIAVHGKSVYWANQGFGQSGGAVMSAPIDGGDSKVLASNQSAVSLAADDANVYWTSAGSPSYAGEVLKYSLAKRTVTTLAADQVLPYGIVLANDRVYWVAQGGDVLECPIAGCPKEPDGETAPVTLASGQLGPTGVGADKTSVYWTNSTNPGTVTKVTPND